MNDKFLVLIHAEVGDMPSERAEKHCERMADNLKAKKPNECLNFLVIPQRDYNTWVEVIPLNGQSEPTQAIESFVYDVPGCEDLERTQ